MKFKHLPIIATLLFSLGFQTSVSAQIYHEVSVMGGYISFRGDYGLRGDSETIRNNSGIGFGVNHYLNFAYTDFISRYTSQHFKVRSSLVYHSTELGHFGALADKDNQAGLQLRSMTGEANVLEIGSGIEYYLMRIRDYERNPGSFTPYAGLGLNFVYYSPVAQTSLEGGLGLPETTFPTFLADPGEEPAFTNESNITLSANFQGGLKYKISRKTDVFAEIRWHYYLSDFVDGLEPIGPQNKNNDWMFWLAFGFNYIID
ncbi:THC0290_0291 family protein [Psychroflexus tropicus]|uniref:THC0290_0291 family protein n=1 Tax=Psychroflexus tropicus TaxID=197345 RepID=UPI000361BBBF|nr:hypothetical protein [Psychroflexus tropicus]